MRTNMMIGAMLLGLSACHEPPKTLDQKLAEAPTPAARKETLLSACVYEAEWPVRSTYYPNRYTVFKFRRMLNGPEIAPMKSLCDKMDALTTPDADDKLPPGELAAMCKKEVLAKRAKGKDGWSEHADRIAKICKEMTGKNV